MIILICFTVLTAGIAQPQKRYKVEIVEEITVEINDIENTQVREAMGNLRTSLTRIFREVSEDCPDISLISRDFTPVSKPSQGNSGFGYTDSEKAEVVLLTRLNYVTRPDENSLILRMDLLHGTNTIDTEEEEFFKLSTFTPDNVKEAKKLKRKLKKMMRKLLKKRTYNRNCLF